MGCSSTLSPFPDRPPGRSGVVHRRPRTLHAPTPRASAPGAASAARPDRFTATEATTRRHDEARPSGDRGRRDRGRGKVDAENMGETDETGGDGVRVDIYIYTLGVQDYFKNGL